MDVLLKLVSPLGSYTQYVLSSIASKTIRSSLITVLTLYKDFRIKREVIY